MIITCPSCSKRYLVEDNSIDPAGRQVQCVSCNHTWFFKPTPTARELNQVHLDLIGSKSTGPTTGKTLNIGWLLLVISFLGVVATAFFARSAVMQMWPATHAVYHVLSLDGGEAQDGLNFENLRPMFVPTAQGQKILLTGTISNQSKGVRQVSSLHITVKGECDQASWWERFWTQTIKHEKADQCVLARWTYEPSESKVYPGERVSFETSSARPLKGAKSIQVQF